MAAGERGQGERDAAARRDHLAALREPEPDRPRMPDHRRRAGENADPFATEPEADVRGNEALEDVEQRDGHAEPTAVRAPHVRGADVAAALLADVLAAEQPHDDDTEGDRADEIPADDDQRVLEHAGRLEHSVDDYAVGMPYEAIQPLTTRQSRFAKNASM